MACENSAPGPSPKSRKRSRRRVKIVEQQSILTLFRLRCDFLGTHFRTLSPTLGPKGPNDPCSRSTDSHGEPFLVRLWRCGSPTPFCEPFNAIEVMKRNNREAVVVLFQAAWLVEVIRSVKRLRNQAYQSA